MIETSNESKILFPEPKITKGELIDYYESIADTMLPHVAGRPLTIRRFPDGIDHDGFFQQERPDYFDKRVDGAVLPRAGKGKSIQHIVVNDARALAYLANQAVIAIHRWLSHIDNPNRPDSVVFDLDPSEPDFSLVRRAARMTGDLLEHVGLRPYLMLTGSRGIHVVAPITVEHDFDEVRRIARRIADRLADSHPEVMTTEHRKHKRGRRVYIDVMRNAYGQTSIAPYSVRAKPGAPIAAPIDWRELARSDLEPQRYKIRNIFRRLSQKDDPWKDISRHSRSLSKALEAL